MPIQLTGSLEVSGSISINGNTVSTSSVSDSVIAGGNFLYNFYGPFDPTYTIDVPAASIVNVHVSQSGVYLMSGSFTTTQSASVNIYYYPDELSAGESAQVWFTSIGTTSATTVRFTWATIISGSESQRYWNSGTTLGTTTSTITSAASTETRRIYRAGTTSTQNPTFFYKASSTNSFVTQGTGQNSIFSTNQTYIEHSGSIGTPIV
jgi:hypothetical protein